MQSIYIFHNPGYSYILQTPYIWMMFSHRQRWNWSFLCMTWWIIATILCNHISVHFRPWKYIDRWLTLAASNGAICRDGEHVYKVHWNWQMLTWVVTMSWNTHSWQEFQDIFLVHLMFFSGVAICTFRMYDCASQASSKSLCTYFRMAHTYIRPCTS